MGSPSNIESLAIRFAPYIEELREFFVRSGVPFGSPEDLLPFAEGIRSPGPFHADMRSMVRSIIYRENKVVTSAELLELLVLAVGGPRVDDAAQDLHQPAGQILGFIRQVYRSLQQGAPAEPSDTAEPNNTAQATNTAEPHSSDAFPGTEADAEHPQEVVSVERRRQTEPALQGALPPPEPAADNESAPVPEAAPPSAPAAWAPSNIFSRAQSLAAHAETAAAAEDVPFVPVSTPAATAASEPIEPVEPLFAEGTQIVPQRETAEAWPSPSLRDIPRGESISELIAETTPAERRPFLVPALYVLAVILLAGFFIQHRHSAGRPLPASAGGLSLVSPAPRVTKPTAYGEPVSSSANADARVRGPASTTLAGEGMRSGLGQSGQTPGQPVSGDAAAPNTVAEAAPLPATDPFGSPDASAPPETGVEAARTVEPPTTHGPESQAHTSRSSRTGPSASHRVFSVSSGIMAANLISAPPPQYPKLASFTHVEGQVILQAVVSRNGTVVATHVLSGHHLLRGAAEHAVRRWRYRPYLVNGRATDVETVVFVNFHLHH